MNFLKSKQKYTLPLLSLVLSTFFYWWMEQAANDQPMFLLAPISALCSLLSGMSFTLWPMDGFYGITRSGIPLIVEKSCSGGVFLVICFTLLSITQLPRFTKPKVRLFGFFCALILSYLTALIASTLRIVSSILMLDLRTSLDPVLVHNVIGIITFVTIICLCYLGVDKFVTTVQEKRTV